MISDYSCYEGFHDKFWKKEIFFYVFSSTYQEVIVHSDFTPVLLLLEYSCENYFSKEEEEKTVKKIFCASSSTSNQKL